MNTRVIEVYRLSPTDFFQKYCCLYCSQRLIKSEHSNDLKRCNKLNMKKKNDQSVHLSGQSGYPVCCGSWQPTSLILMRWSLVCQHMKVKNQVMTYIGQRQQNRSWRLADFFFKTKIIFDTNVINDNRTCCKNAWGRFTINRVHEIAFGFGGPH